mgnify:CR=1 FL=1
MEELREAHSFIYSNVYFGLDIGFGDGLSSFGVETLVGAEIFG